MPQSPALHIVVCRHVNAVTWVERHREERSFFSEWIRGEVYVEEVEGRRIIVLGFKDIYINVLAVDGTDNLELFRALEEADVLFVFQALGFAALEGTPLGVELRGRA